MDFHENPLEYDFIGGRSTFLPTYVYDCGTPAF